LLSSNRVNVCAGTRRQLTRGHKRNSNCLWRSSEVIPKELDHLLLGGSERSDVVESVLNLVGPGHSSKRSPIRIQTGCRPRSASR
jgi:hypothetical protein